MRLYQKCILKKPGKILFSSVPSVFLSLCFPVVKLTADGTLLV